MAVALSDMRVLQKLSVEFLEGRAGVLSQAGAIVMDTGLPEEVLTYIADAYGGDIPIFVDPVSTAYAKKLRGRLRGLHTVKPNLLETEVLAGMEIKNPRDLEEAACRLLSQGPLRLVVSLGREGVYYRDRDGLALWVRGDPIRQVVNATGAGDALLGGLLYTFIKGDPPEQALPFAVAVSRMALSHRNTINPDISREAGAAAMERDKIAVTRL